MDVPETGINVGNDRTNIGLKTVDFRNDSLARDIVFGRFQFGKEIVEIDISTRALRAETQINMNNGTTK